MAEICATCKFFDTENRVSSLTRALIATGGRHNPTTRDILLARSIDKDGDCRFMPEKVARHKEDFCGQWKAKEG